MNKNDNIYGESREQKNEMQNNSRTNANTNDLDSRSNSGDNSGMHAGGTAGSSYQQQPENPELLRVGQRQGADRQIVLLQNLADRAEAAGAIFHEQ